MRVVLWWLIAVAFMEAGLVGGALLFGEWGILPGQFVGSLLGLGLLYLIYRRTGGPT